MGRESAERGTRERRVGAHLVTSNREHAQLPAVREHAVPDRVEVPPAALAAYGDVVAAAVTLGQREPAGRYERPGVARLVDVADEVQEPAQAHGLLGWGDLFVAGT